VYTHLLWIFNFFQINYVILLGNSKLVLLPKSTEELSSILKYCNEKSLAITPQGGNTGLVGGSVPVYDEIVVSTKLMNQIYSIDTDSNILKSQSGCILQNLDEYLGQHNLMVPLDLGIEYIYIISIYI
jgi:FAD/FMN-containing dehydrogenase